MTQSVIFVRDNDFSWRAREVLREVADQPHLLVRLDVLGPYFPHRDSAPFVRLVAGRRRAVEALFTDVADDQSALRAYFPTDVQLRGQIQFGYAGQVLGTIAVGREAPVERLDENRIDGAFHRVTSGDLGAFAAHRR